MFGSKNEFFKLDVQTLSRARSDVEVLLKIKGRSKSDIQEYLHAFDYFVLNPTDYDGATIVKDLVDIRISGEYLDVDAMLHDFEYINGASKGFISKWKSDIKYIKGMELNGKGIRVPRFLILTIAGLALIPYKNLTKQ